MGKSDGFRCHSELLSPSARVGMDSGVRGQGKGEDCTDNACAVGLPESIHSVQGLRGRAWWALVAKRALLWGLSPCRRGGSGREGRWDDHGANGCFMFIFSTGIGQ